MIQSRYTLSRGINSPFAAGPNDFSSHPTSRSAPLVTSSRFATICQVLHGLNMGGAEVLAAQLARQLQGQYRFLFVCLDELGSLGEELKNEGFLVRVLDREPGLSIRCLRELAGIVRHEGVDLLHAHQYTPFFYSAICRIMGKQLPVLFTEHGRHHPDHPSTKRRLGNRALLRRRDRVVAVGEAVRQALIQNEGIPPRRVEVIYNGILNERFNLKLNKSERDALRAEIGLRPDDLMLIQVARMDYLKDHATAIRTQERLISRKDNARLVLVGDGPEREAMQKLVRDRGLEACVKFLGLRTDIPRLMAVADIALLTSISEGIPLTLIEAMATGLPVVATDVGGVAEVLEAGLTGLIVRSGDDQALASEVFRLFNDRELRERMGRQGRERAISLFSERRMHACYSRVYRDMLDG